MVGLDSNATNGWNFFFQHLGISRKTSSCADSHDEFINTVSKFVDDLSCHLMIGIPVINIVELIGPECVGLFTQFPGSFYHRVDELCRYLSIAAWKNFKLRPECLHGLQFFCRKRI